MCYTLVIFNIFQASRLYCIIRIHYKFNSLSTGHTLTDNYNFRFVFQLKSKYIKYVLKYITLKKKQL